MAFVHTLAAAAAAGVLAAAHVAGAAAGGGPAISHAKLFSNRARTVACGIEIPAQRPTEVLCGARGIPRPTGRAGDPYAQIAAAGRPRLVLISQASYVTTTATMLPSGTLWSSLGVTCSVGAGTILCFNHSNHGFLVGPGTYTTF